MHLFKHFFKMIGKHKNHIIIYSIIFAVMMVVFVVQGGFGNTEESKSVTDSSYTIGYIDNSGSAESRGLIDYLNAQNDLIDLEGKSEDSIKTMVYFTSVNMFINIDKDFTDKIAAGDDTAITFLSAADDGPSAYIMTSMINTYISTYETFIKLGFEPSKAAELTFDNLSLKADSYVLVGEEDGASDSHSKLFTLNYMAKFFIYISFGVIAQCVGTVIIKNNSGNVDSRIRISPVSSISQSAANIAGLSVCGLIVWILGCAIIFISGSGLSLLREYGFQIAAVLLAICICNCALTSFIASFRISTDTLPMIVNIVGLGMSFLCGVFVPQSIMADGVVKASRFIPFYWGVVALDSMNNVTGSIAEYSPKLLGTSIFMILLFTVIFAVGGIAVRRTQTYSKIR